MFSQEDLKQIEANGSSLAKVEKEIRQFKNGFPWMEIVAPATPERGIAVLDESQTEKAIAYYEHADVEGKCKFVPASGAASRMFKDIFSGLSRLNSGEDVREDSPVALLSAQIENFAFYDPALFGRPQDSQAYRRSVASKLLTDEGLGYGTKPKGVLKFHSYEGEARTAFAEHLVEAQEYMRNSDGTASLVVTVSPEHLDLFKAALAQVRETYQAKYGVKYNVKFTFQDKSTDTVAVDADDEPFRTDDGRLLLRPAGHGALIHNLNELSEELVSIKNIDNVSKERLLPITARYKKVLMGKCLELRDKIRSYLVAFEGIGCPKCKGAGELCEEVETFLRDELCVELPPLEGAERMAMLKAKLNRPIRVCGMVKNEGEPGGGPFIVRGKDGSTNLQILESVQVNKADEKAVAALSGATHFNPVDLVCCLHDFKGQKFDLLKYVDPDAGFISSKSYQGRELKALELPGLWNGAMSDWNTLFVEVPLETFNPVKVVLDLLRPAHR